MFTKYALEGLAVALAVSIVSRGNTSFVEFLLLAFSAMAVFLVLDLYAPLTGASARQGAGFGLGLKMVGVGGGQNEQVAGSHYPGHQDAGSHYPGHQDAGSHYPGHQDAGAPDMCGGGLVEALQHAGGDGVNIPYKIVNGQYGSSLQAGFNENAEGYNEAELTKLASF